MMRILYLIALIISNNIWAQNVANDSTGAEYTRLAAELKTIFKSDQLYRKQRDSVEKALGYNAAEYITLVKNMERADSTNRVIVKEILAKYGWPGKSKIGDVGFAAIFLVVQHGDLPTQIDCLPLLSKTIKDNDGDASYLALMEDRVAISRGEKQLYGTQVWGTGSKYELRPLADPDNVDKRRAKMGLEPLAKYLAQFGITWDLAAYKKANPAPETKKVHKR